MTVPERIRRPVYSCFIVTNLLVIGYCNLPHSVGSGIAADLRRFKSHATQSAASAQTPHQYALSVVQWFGVHYAQQMATAGDRYLRKYAHYTGLDNRWQMFGLQSRFNWWYVIKARYREGSREEEIVLDLPRQSEQSGVPRTRWQYHFFDFREGKFHLNMYREPYDRAAYARYLARKYPEHDGMPVESVVYELHFQHIKPPEEARRTGSHLYPETYHFIYNRFRAEGEVELDRTAYSLPPPEAAEMVDPAADGHRPKAANQPE